MWRIREDSGKVREETDWKSLGDRVKNGNALSVNGRPHAGSGGLGGYIFRVPNISD
jgi:hypothetical protein